MGRLGRGRLSEGCLNKIQRCTFYSVNWPCRSTKLFAIIFLNFEINCIVPKKLGDILFHIVSPQTMSCIAQMQYIAHFRRSHFHIGHPSQWWSKEFSPLGEEAFLRWILFLKFFTLRVFFFDGSGA